MVVLHIETSASNCSVALSDNEKCLFYKVDTKGRNHAAQVHLFIEEGMQFLRNKGISIEAVAVSSGPGSYTGLRIGVSSAKGICYALDIPLISISTLEIIALQTKQLLKTTGNILFVPMIDARRMEVYVAAYDNNVTLIQEARAEILTSDSFNELLANNIVCFSGDGSEKFKSLISGQNAIFYDNIHPDAATMIPLALKKLKLNMVEDLAYFEPSYVKEFYTTAKTTGTQSNNL